MSNETTTSHVLNEPTSDQTDVNQPAETATRILKRPGRKGDKIKNAFLNIPATPVNFIEYAASQNVSPNVLRQIKRHDIYPESGKVFVRKNKETKTMMIWRAAKKR